MSNETVILDSCNTAAKKWFISASTASTAALTFSRFLYLRYDKQAPATSGRLYIFGCRRGH